MGIGSPGGGWGRGDLVWGGWDWWNWESGGRRRGNGDGGRRPGPARRPPLLHGHQSRRQQQRKLRRGSVARRRRRGCRAHRHCGGLVGREGGRQGLRGLSERVSGGLRDD